MDLMTLQKKPISGTVENRPVLAVVQQVDEGLGVASRRRVVHRAQTAVVPQDGVGLVLWKFRFAALRELPC